MTADTVESTQLVSIATTTEIATSVVENGPTIDTSRYGSLTPTGRSKTTKEKKSIYRKNWRRFSSTDQELDKIFHYYYYDFDNGRYGASTLENVDGENRSSDNIDSNDIPILPMMWSGFIESWDSDKYRNPWD